MSAVSSEQVNSGPFAPPDLPVRSWNVKQTGDSRLKSDTKVMVALARKPTFLGEPR